MRLAFLAVLAIAACGDSYGSEPTPPSGDAGPADATADAGAGAVDAGDAALDATPAAPCTPGEPFGGARLVLTSAFKGAWSATLSPDETTMYYAEDVTADAGVDYDIFRTTRATTTEPFVAGSAVKELSSKLPDSNASVSADGLLVVFTRETDVNFGAGDLFFSTRVSSQVTFSTPQKLALDSPTDDESTPYLRPDGGALWLSVRSGSKSFDLFRARAEGGDFVAPTKVVELSTDKNDWYPVVTKDELEVFWSSDRTDGAVGAYDIWTASRKSTDDAFSNVRIVSEISTTASDIPSWISPDACRLYYWTTKGGRREIWMAERAR